MEFVGVEDQKEMDLARALQRVHGETEAEQNRQLEDLSRRAAIEAVRQSTPQRKQP